MRIRKAHILKSPASPSSGGVPPGLPDPQQLFPSDVPLHALAAPADPRAAAVARHHGGSAPGVQPAAGAAGPRQAVRGRQRARHHQAGAVLQLHDVLPHLQDGETHVLRILHGPLEPLPGTHRYYSLSNVLFI